jgi:hypothetical protein
MHEVTFIFHTCTHSRGSIRRSLLHVAAALTTAILSIITLAGEQHSGSAYSQTRTDVHNKSLCVQLLCFFLLSQPSQFPVSHTTLPYTISFPQTKTLQLLMTRFVSPTDSLSVSEPTTLWPSHKRKWQMALSISTWTLSDGQRLTYALRTFRRISTDKCGHTMVPWSSTEFFRCCAAQIV